MDEEVFDVLRCLGDYHVIEPAVAAHAGKEPLRHIAFLRNVHHRRFRRFAGEPLCSSKVVARSGAARVNENPSCRSCLALARKLTEVPPDPVEDSQQLRLFETA